MADERRARELSVHITELAEAYDQESDVTKILVSLHDYVESRSRAVEDETEDGDADDDET